MSTANATITQEDLFLLRDPVELAWASGLFIGEGCVMTKTSGSPHRYTYLHVDMRMYDERAIRRFCGITGARYGLTHSKQTDHDVHGAGATGRSAERLLAILWPYIEHTDKGDQALRKAAELGVQDWITGARTDARPQSSERPRGPRRTRR